MDKYSHLYSHFCIHSRFAMIRLSSFGGLENKSSPSEHLISYLIFHLRFLSFFFTQIEKGSLLYHFLLNKWDIFTWDPLLKYLWYNYFESTGNTPVGLWKKLWGGGLFLKSTKQVWALLLPLKTMYYIRHLNLKYIAIIYPIVRVNWH
jgi:hypothetical protein